MAKVVHRYQELHRRTWCSSSPVRPLAAWKFSSVAHLIPATLTRAGSGMWRGGEQGGNARPPGGGGGGGRRQAGPRPRGGAAGPRPAAERGGPGPPPPPDTTHTPP